MPQGPDGADEFCAFALPLRDGLFEELLASARLETVGKGRLGGVLTKTDETLGAPIVRTTTRYSLAAQCFRSVHDELSREIQRCASLPVAFNNTLIEKYTDAYTTMGSHSDQALDLADDSFIAVFSCYEHPGSAGAPRRLIVESKDASGGEFEVPLTHNTAVVFSVGTNRRFRHKIVLAKSAGTPENPWLGLTFRTSKTFVRLRGEHVCFSDDTRLTLANDEQRQEFYRLRRRENNETDFTYPRIAYTVSESDLLPPLP